MQTSSKHIDNLLKNDFITCGDIMDIINLDNNQFLDYYPNITTEREKILSEIYLNPKIIYECKNTSEKLINRLVDFVIYKYTSNNNELLYRLELGQISFEEYNKILQEMDAYYFPEDSFIGMVIKEKLENQEKGRVNIKTK